ncbi:MAG: GDP-mannose 4,6-dehydratase [candidate division WOR-3 bacterium]|nr:GDP-mannose 4,6-dehydratase [candidate division WOR-3 bacterium]
MKALITGISGFAGSHLAEYLLSLNFEVFGTIKWRSRLENIQHILNRIKLFECDIRDATAVKYVLSETRPDYIFHLAAQSYVPFSWRAPSETLTTNIIGEVNIFEGVRELKIDPFIHIAGSSEEYGLVYPDEVPIKETNPLRPLSPYAVSKVAQDLLGFQYYRSYGLKIVRTRAFNHTGPRRGEVFVSSNFARQLVEIEKKKREPVIYVGNLEAVRDFSDVRDVVRGYYLALKKGVPGEVYNIASGKGIKIRELLNRLIEMTNIDLKIVPDPSRMRPSDVELLIGSYEKFQSATGWQPEIPFDKTLRDLLDYWRSRI